MNYFDLGLIISCTLLIFVMSVNGRFNIDRTPAAPALSKRNKVAHPPYASFRGTLKDKQNELIKRFHGSYEVVYSMTQNDVTYWINSSQKLVTGVPVDLSENLRDVLLTQGLVVIKKRWLVAVRKYRPSTRIHSGTLRMILSLLSNELMDPRNHLFTSAAAPRNQHLSRNSILEIDRFPHQSSHAGHVSPRLYGECDGYNSPILLGECAATAKGDMYLRSIGRVMGVAIINKQFMDVSFTSTFYKIILGKKIDVYDIQHINPQLYLELKSVLDSSISEGITTNTGLRVNGAIMTNDNKEQYVETAVESYYNKDIAPAMNSLCEGLYEIIPKEAFAMFNEKELEVLISGNTHIDTGDWRTYTSHQALLYVFNWQSVKWFWRMVNEWDMDMRSRLLLFVTGTSRLPINGFKKGFRHFKLSSWFNIAMLDNKPDGYPKANPKTRVLYLPSYSSYEILERKFRTTVRLNGGVSTWYKPSGHLRFTQK